MTPRLTQGVSRSRLVALEQRAPGLPPGEARGVREAALDELRALAQRPLDPRGDRLRRLRVDPHGCVAAGLVERRVRGDDARRPARHRLQHRHAEALEARRVDEDVRAAIEPRELLVGDEAEWADAV